MYSVPKLPSAGKPHRLLRTAKTVEDKGDKMTTKDTTEETTDGGGLRKQLEAQIAENKVLKADARTRAFSDAGFDTTTGLGKAVSQVYTGADDKDAILKFAHDEYGHIPTPTEAQPQVHPKAAQIALGQAQLDQVGNVAGSVTQTTRQERLATAVATNDFEAQGAIQAAQMQDMMDAQAQPPT